MRALRKPHRIAVIVPTLTVQGADQAYEREAALLLWCACIDVLQRHPNVAVFDAESTILVPREEHFVPEHAVHGARPTDTFFGPTRRDELIWLDLSFPPTRPVRLHAMGRDGGHAVFDGGDVRAALGEQVQHALTSWLASRGLAPPPRRFEAVSADAVMSTVRALGPTLVEHARVWIRPGSSFDSDLESRSEPRPPATARGRVGRTVANRLPAALRVPALRVLELALGEELSDLILAVDAEHPQALFAAYLAALPLQRDLALLRRVIRSAPCWARPYAELIAGSDDPSSPAAPSELELVAGAGIAAVCRPGSLEVIQTVSKLLDRAGLVDEGVRLVERTLATAPEDPRTHLALLERLDGADRDGVYLERAERSRVVHGCPSRDYLPWYADQIQIDLHAADAMLRVGRLDDAIALRARRLEGRQGKWPGQTRTLQRWREDARFVAWCYARDGAYRGDPARVLEGFGLVEPDGDVDVAMFLDALVAMGCEDEAGLAWGRFGRGRGHTGPTARLAAARAACAAGDWRCALEEMWRVELTEPGRDDHTAIARIGLLVAGSPLEIAEQAIGERLAVGAQALARRMARTVADFHPGAATSETILRALGRASSTSFDRAALDAFSESTSGRHAIDALFAELAPAAATSAGEGGARLVQRWLEAVFAEGRARDPASIAQAASYAAAQALGRYFAATTSAPSPFTGALRTVASEAFAVVRVYRESLADHDARAVLRVIEPWLRRVDRWLGASWLATIERSCAIDERSHGDLDGFAHATPTAAARILGPEDTAVLAGSIARLHRDRPERWAAAVDAQAAQLALHTGALGVDEWADAVVTRLGANEIEIAEALDSLHLAVYLAHGISARPGLHLARVLLGRDRGAQHAGGGAAAFEVLCECLPAAEPEARDRHVSSLADAWQRERVDVPISVDHATAALTEARDREDWPRVAKLARWVVARSPDDVDAHRDLGIALARQGRAADAIGHLTRANDADAMRIVADALVQGGYTTEAITVLDHASRWYRSTEAWLAYAATARHNLDPRRAHRGYAMAWTLDPGALSREALDDYASVLDEVGEHARCELVARALLERAGGDVRWQTTAWHHLACANIGLGHFADAERFAADAVAHDPAPARRPQLEATLVRARSQADAPKTLSTSSSAPAEPARDARPGPTPSARPLARVFELMQVGDLASAAEMRHDTSWRVRLAALEAARFRTEAENEVSVTSRALRAAIAVLEDTIGMTDRVRVLARTLAMQIREQALFPRDPVPRLGRRMSRAELVTAFRDRGGVVAGSEPSPVQDAAPGDRVVVPGGRIERLDEYVALVRDLAALPPGEALAQFELDAVAYEQLGAAWGAALDGEPALVDALVASLRSKK